MSEAESPLWQAAGGGREGATGSMSVGYPYFSKVDKNCQQRPRHGVVTGGVWRKDVRASVHRLKVPKGWAVDVADLDAAEAMGVRFICLHDMEGLTESWASLATLRKWGFRLDRGFGDQLALTLEHWQPTRRAAIEADKPRAGAPAQLGLWGMTS